MVWLQWLSKSAGWQWRTGAVRTDAAGNWTQTFTWDSNTLGDLNGLTGTFQMRAVANHDVGWVYSPEVSMAVSAALPPPTPPDWTPALVATPLIFVLAIIVVNEVSRFAVLPK